MQEKIRLTYVVGTNIRWVAFEHIARDLDRERFDLSFILISNGDAPLAAYLGEHGIPYQQIQYSSDADIPRATWEVYRYCRTHRPDIVHTHFNGNTAGLIGALLSGVQVRVVTRHFPGRPWHTVRAKVRAFARVHLLCATHVVAIDKLIRDVLLAAGVTPGNLSLVYHGFDFDSFQNVPAENVLALKKKYLPDGASPVVGVVSRYMEYKGVEFVIAAFERLLADYPSAFLVLAGAHGPHEKVIKQRLKAIPRDRYVEIPFEADLFALFRMFDVFVHVPFSPGAEAFGQVYIEALAAGVPCVFTRSGIALEFAEHRKNCWIVDYRNSEQIYEGVRVLLEDAALREALVRNGRQCAAEMFPLDRMIDSLETMYITLFENRGGVHQPRRIRS